MDVWWVTGEGRLLTLLPLLLRRHPHWAGCRVRLFAVSAGGRSPAGAGPGGGRGLGGPPRLVRLDVGDVSTYTYERTLMMEQRAQMLRQLRQRAQGSPAHSAWEEEEEEEEEEGAGGGAPRQGPNPANVRRMAAAERLNEALGERSGGARLVLLDLPPPPPPPRGAAPRELPGVRGGADGGAGAGAAGAGGRRGPPQPLSAPVWTSTDQYGPGRRRAAPQLFPHRPTTGPVLPVRAPRRSHTVLAGAAPLPVWPQRSQYGPSAPSTAPARAAAARVQSQYGPSAPSMDPEAPSAASTAPSAPSSGPSAPSMDPEAPSAASMTPSAPSSGPSAPSMGPEAPSAPSSGPSTPSMDPDVGPRPRAHQ
ncbi:uncharacterized protein LOC141735289 [Larus michahellis]|uniref:uncharacterized protein LOC141735289 n=1 Tax=Larus michahellis TaxID=119627 RepID=UPI003D9B4A81